MITCPSCRHKNNDWAKACVKCTAPLTATSKYNSNEIVGYKCPACKTSNYGNRNHCFKCGHWLLDTKFQAEPIAKNEVKEKVYYGYNDYKEPPRPKTFIIGKIFMWLGVIFVILLIIGGLGNTTKHTDSATETLEQFSLAVNDIPYDELARNADSHIGERIHYIGKVIQVIENPPALRINIATPNQHGYVTENKIILVSRNDNTGRLLENDIVEIWGIVKGISTYKAVFGQSITVPEIKSKYLTIVR